jgi:hypothetical protein
LAVFFCLQNKERTIGTQINTDEHGVGKKLDTVTQVSGVSSKKVRAILKPGPPPAEHLKPILRKGFNTPDNAKKRAIFIVNYEV